jgi:hypothetical protein
MTPEDFEATLENVKERIPEKPATDLKSLSSTRFGILSLNHSREFWERRWIIRRAVFDFQTSSSSRMDLR